MSIAEAVILGIIQGLTEFLPISSSGHLVLAQSILGIEQPGNEFEVLVHIGTLISILVVFKNDIKKLLFSLDSKKTQKFIFFLIIGTIPAIVIGLGFKDFIESLFDNLFAVGVALIFTGIILYCTSYLTNKNKKNHSILTSSLIGCAQAVAIIPGISRSGMTISLALFLGFSSKEAARFSFLLAIPVISGAGILTSLNIKEANEVSFLIGIIGIVTSFLVGFIALKWLLVLLEKGNIYYFGLYCLTIGLITIFI